MNKNASQWHHTHKKKTLINNLHYDNSLPGRGKVNHIHWLLEKTKTPTNKNKREKMPKIWHQTTKNQPKKQQKKKTTKQKIKQTITRIEHVFLDQQAKTDHATKSDSRTEFLKPSDHQSNYRMAQTPNNPYRIMEAYTNNNERQHTSPNQKNYGP